MPRIPPLAVRQAHRLSPHAAHLLPVCRDLPSALNEARWIREHVVQIQKDPSSSSPGQKEHGLVDEEDKMESLCRRRARGEPLQYVLGTQPFGELEMKCRPGVLIPRPEPEAYTNYLATLLRQQKPPLLPGLLVGGRQPGRQGDNTTTPLEQQHTPLRILDLCTGTGCIALLLYSLLQQRRTTTSPPLFRLSVHGVDISPHAVALAHENTRHNHLVPPPLSPHQLHFTQGDIFSDAWLDSLCPPPPLYPPSSSSSSTSTSSCVDVLICNPPYVSPWGFARQTARSVRHFEPKLAQVPMVAYHPPPGAPLEANPEEEDVFYARLLDVAAARLRPRVMLFEVGDLAQAVRVASMAWRHAGLRPRLLSVEIWRDCPDATPADDERTSVTLGRGHHHHDDNDGKGIEVRVRGTGHGRSVFIQCQ